MGRAPYSQRRRESTDFSGSVLVSQEPDEPLHLTARRRRKGGFGQLQAATVDGQRRRVVPCVDHHETRSLEMLRHILRVRDGPGRHPQHATLASLEHLDTRGPLDGKMADEEPWQRPERTSQQPKRTLAPRHEGVGDLEFRLAGDVHHQSHSKEHASARPEQSRAPRWRWDVRSVSLPSLTRLLEDEGVRDDHDASALRLREDPGAHAAGDTGLELRIAHRRLRDRRGGDRA